MPTSGYSKRIGECTYCGIICDGSGTADHIIPRSQIKRIRHNKVLACRRCNQAKADMSVEDFKKTIYYQQNCLSGRWRGLVLRNDNLKSVNAYADLKEGKSISL